ncbi:MAG: glucose-6-phosphate isomerase [Chloroflexi bacterium]|nr:glucose-6-phosphate isomerase [Chloroflexota bacterium]
MKDKFKVDGLKFQLGEYEKSLGAAIKKAEADHLVKRIWARDYTVWKPDPSEISNRLGWLDTAERMRAEVPLILDFVESTKSDNIDRVLLLGMGGSSLAPELFSKMFGAKNGLALSVLDSTDPEAVLEKEKEHDSNRTLYIVSSKSGGTVETASFFKYFYNQAQGKLGTAKVGRHFVAITDPGSGLAKTGEQFEFRHVFLADPNIGGRYSALSHFGLVPAALVGVDLERLLSSAEEMADRCKEKFVADNPGAMLGVVLGTLAAMGRDKATLVLSEAKASFGDWVEQLLAESTGKEGKGILPVAREPELNDYGNDRIFISLEDLGKSPEIDLDWKEGYDLGAQFFLWEFATAVAGYVLGINPFDQPNVESAKLQAGGLINDYRKSGKLPKGETEVLSWSALELFLGKAKDGDYIALQVYGPRSSKLSNALQQLRAILSQRTKLATTVGYGPGFLHSSGQLHKGDRGNGLFLQLIHSAPDNDLPIPTVAGQAASDLTFGVLKVAQALGDAQALRKSGRRVLSFEIEDDVTTAIDALVFEVSN